MTSRAIRILLVSGSTRSGSTNTAALRAAHAIEDEDITTVLYDGLAALPHFNPDDDADPLPPPVTDLREQIAAADGVLFCTPEYAGALPGSFKNLLDWTVGGIEMYGKPVAWINVAGGGRGENADASLRTVLGYVGATLLASAATRLTVERSELGADGRIGPGDLRDRIEQVVRAFADELRATGPDS
jgi:chromate reductase